MPADTLPPDDVRILASCLSRTCSWRGEDHEAVQVRGVARCPSCNSPVGFEVAEGAGAPSAPAINDPAATEAQGATHAMRVRAELAELGVALQRRDEIHRRGLARAVVQGQTAPPYLLAAAQVLVRAAQPLALNLALSLVATKYVDELRAALASIGESAEHRQARLEALVVKLAEARREAREAHRREGAAWARAAVWEARAVVLRKALAEAQRVLKWGHEEMRGRPPQHWLDALALVERELAAAEAPADAPAAAAAPSSGTPEQDGGAAGAAPPAHKEPIDV